MSLLDCPVPPKPTSARVVRFNEDVVEEKTAQDYLDKQKRAGLKQAKRRKKRIHSSDEPVGPVHGYFGLRMIEE